MGRVRVYIACHADSAYMKDEVFAPVQVGCALSGHTEIPGMLHDDAGDSISKKNARYCELTAQYWAWKNERADYYGFFHYRRYLNFSGTEFAENADGDVAESRLTPASAEKYGLRGDRVRRMTEHYDVIIPRRKDLRRMSGRFANPLDQYAGAEFLEGEDLRRMARLICRRTPEYSEAVREFLRGGRMCFCNMYILRRDIFFEYCEWLFPLLDEFCRISDMDRYSREALRTPGHLAERMFNIFLIRYLKDHPETRVKELQCVEFLCTAPFHPLGRAFPEERTPQETASQEAALQKTVVPVVFACSREYIPVFSVCLRSLLDHAGADALYDIVLIIRNIGDGQKDVLHRMTAPYPNVSLRFVDPLPLLEGYTLKANAHISVETYYRFLIQEILPEYDRVLYLDSDMVIRADVRDLFETDLEGNVIGAARDIDFLGQIGGYSPDTVRYSREKLSMKDPGGYFQAGVLLIDERQMRNLHSTEEWLSLSSVPHRFNDQDVLNEACEGRVLYLPMEWNVVTDAGHTRIRGAVRYAPAAVQDEYFRARKAPKILHYAGAMKPWSHLGEDFGDCFWETARRSPYYEQLARAVKEPGDGSEDLHDRIRNFINEHFPAGSEQRRKIDRLYAKFYMKH